MINNQSINYNASEQTKIAWEYFATNEYEKALECFTKILENDYRDVDSWLGKALTLK